MDAELLILLILPGIGLVQAGLMLVHAWEHRRYHARRWASRIEPATGLSVGLVVPCKGLDPDLATNLLALFRQWYPRYELCFVVESETDRAIPVITSLARENPQVPHRLVISGLANDCGQKVHNLMAAVDTILGVNCDGKRPPLPDSEVAPFFGEEERGRQGEGETRRNIAPSPSLVAERRTT